MENQKDTTRAKRRVETKKHGNRMFKIYHRDDKEYFIDDPKSEAKLKGIYSKTKVPCSKSCCGNPRRHYGKKTIQEKKQTQVEFEAHYESHDAEMYLNEYSYEDDFFDEQDNIEYGRKMGYIK